MTSEDDGVARFGIAGHSTVILSTFVIIYNMNSGDCVKQKSGSRKLNVRVNASSEYYDKNAMAVT